MKTLRPPTLADKILSFFPFTEKLNHIWFSYDPYISNDKDKTDKEIRYNERSALYATIGFRIALYSNYAVFGYLIKTIFFD